MRFQLDLTKEYGLYWRAVVPEDHIRSAPGKPSGKPELRSAESRVHQWAP